MTSADDTSPTAPRKVTRTRRASGATTPPAVPTTEKVSGAADVNGTAHPASGSAETTAKPVRTRASRATSRIKPAVSATTKAPMPADTSFSSPETASAPASSSVPEAVSSVTVPRTRKAPVRARKAATSTEVPETAPTPAPSATTEAAPAKAPRRTRAKAAAESTADAAPAPEPAAGRARRISTAAAVREAEAAAASAPVAEAESVPARTTRVTRRSSTAKKESNAEAPGSVEQPELPIAVEQRTAPAAEAPAERRSVSRRRDASRSAEPLPAAPAPAAAQPADLGPNAYLGRPVSADKSRVWPRHRNEEVDWTPSPTSAASDAPSQATAPASQPDRPAEIAQTPATPRVTSAEVRAAAYAKPQRPPAPAPGADATGPVESASAVPAPAAPLSTSPGAMIIESAPRQFFRAPRHNRPAPAAAATASATAESAAPAATQPPAAQPQPQPAQPHTQHQHGSGGGGHNNGGGNSNDSRQFFKKQKGQHATREHFGHGPREDRFGRQNRHDRNANRHGNQQGGGQGGHGYDKHDRQDRFSRKDRDRNQQHGNDRHQNGHAHGGTNNGHVNGHHHEDAAVAAIQAEPAIPATPAVPLPPGKTLNLRELQQMNIVALHEFAKEFVENSLNFKKHDLICEILKRNEARGGEMIGEGILELLPEGYGFLRAACFSYATCPEDVFLTPQQVRRYGIRKGDHVTGLVRAPKPNEKYFTMMRVDTIHGIPAEEPREKAVFDNLTPIFPNRRIILEGKSRDVSMRVLDLLCPIGFGQRGLIIAPPRVGKTILLQKIASAIMENNPDVHLIMLLIDERPEEVTDMERTVKGEVISSTFDESPERHIHVCEMVAERAKRLVENKKDVVILLDSITRLSRAYNNMTQGGRTGSGGLDTNALQKPKRFFGAARNLEEGGSLTIIATALVDTGSRMDQVIYEEYKGTGNLDIQLDRSLAERRIFPALNINASGTRKDDGLYHRDELDRINLLRRALHLFTPIEAMEALIKKLILSDTNMELLMSLKPDGMQM